MIIITATDNSYNFSGCYLKEVKITDLKSAPEQLSPTIVGQSCNCEDIQNFQDGRNLIIVSKANNFCGCKVFEETNQNPPKLIGTYLEGIAFKPCDVETLKLNEYLKPIRKLLNL